MAWEQQFVCLECQAECPDFANGFPDGPCQDGGGGCAVTPVWVWVGDVPAPEPPSPFAPASPRQGAAPWPPRAAGA